MTSVKIKLIFGQEIKIKQKLDYMLENFLRDSLEKVSEDSAETYGLIRNAMSPGSGFCAPDLSLSLSTSKRRDAYRHWRSI